MANRYPKAFKSPEGTFISENRQAYREAHPHMTEMGILSMMVSAWIKLDIIQKNKYIGIAEADKQRYMAEMYEFFSRESAALKRL
jgi:hypothetical protein